MPSGPWTTLTINRTFTLDNIRTIISNPLYPTVLVRTFLMALAVTLTDIVLAFPIAFYVAKRVAGIGNYC